MKFFTLQWWCEAQHGTAQDMTAGYSAHLERIRARVVVPAQAATFERLNQVGLHDCRLRELDLDLERRTLRVDFDTYWEGGTVGLRYRGVRQFKSSADPKLGLPGPLGYGDAGYDEIDLTSDGGFVHRLLFSTGIEWEVVFEDFDFERGGVPEPWGPPSVSG